MAGVNGRATLPALSGQPLPAAMPWGSEADARQWVNAVYRRQFRFVWRALRGLGVPEAQLDDAVQDVFIVVFRRRHDYREDRSERSWLFRIARYVAGNVHRTRRRKGGLLPLQEELAGDAEPGPEQRLALKEAVDVLGRFLETLDEDQREAFVCIELAGMTAPEAAEALDAKLNTIYSRVRLARGRWERFVAGLSSVAKGVGHE